MACDNAETPSVQLSQKAAETAVLCLVNEERASRGLAELTPNRYLRIAAREHALEAKRLKWWVPGADMHTNPETGSVPLARIRGAGYCPRRDSVPVGENAYHAWYAGSGADVLYRTSPQAAFEAWMDSTPHREAILNPNFRESGVGVVLGIAEEGTPVEDGDGGAIFVQTFGGCEIVDPELTAKAWGWGDNGRGAVGDGTNVNRYTPVAVQNPDEMAWVSAAAHSLAVKEDGTVWSWGPNPSGELGDGTLQGRNAPGEVDGLTNVVSVSAGKEHSLALRNDGTVWAWGRNRHGQLGDGTNLDRRRPVRVNGLEGITQISAGGDHSLAVRDDGTAWGWGGNYFGQLGIGSLDDYVNEPRQVEMIFDRRVLAVAAGNRHSMAIEAETRGVYTWGENYSGQLGYSFGYTYVWFPKQVPQFYGAKAIAAGRDHSLVVKQDGTAWGWGANGNGQVGDGSSTDEHFEPVRVANLTQVVGIAGGLFHSLAIRADGRVWAWGFNTGCLGDGTTDERRTPVSVPEVSGALVVAGGHAHSLATGVVSER